ncbi:MAG: hypothetical protein H7A46_26720, partial [Verrucomicrobiales bacterium]|nr:hypothetical protein [Verrucomicrobiales bacterium]
MASLNLVGVGQVGTAVSPGLLTDGQYGVSGWTTEAGLPQNTVTCALQGRDGYLWVGTRYGLARFDGVRFTSFADNLAKVATDALDVRSLAEDAGGRLWLASRQGVVCLSQGRFESVALDGCPFSGAIQDICVTPDAALWVARVDGLFRLKASQVDWQLGLRSFADDYHGSPPEIERVLSDSRGRLWVLITYFAGQVPRWQRLDPASGELKLLADLTGVTPLDVGALIEDRAGRLWLGRPGELLCWEDGRLTHFPATTAWGDQPVKALCEDAGGNLWIASRGPVQLHRFAGGSFSSFDRSTGLANPDDVRCLLPDREGNLWVGMGSGGLARLQPRHLLSLLTGSYSTEDEVYSVSPGRDGKVWMATPYGLVRFQQGEFTVYTNTTVRVPDGYTLRTRMVLEDRSGGVWAGLDRGLWTLREGVFEPVEIPHLVGEGRPLISSMIEDRRGALWFGTPSGVLEWFNGEFRLWTVDDGLSDPFVFGLVEGPDGSIWAGTERGGVNRFHEGRFRAYTIQDGLLSDEAWPLRAESDGTVWVGTPRGLNRIRGDEVRSVTAEQGLYDNLAYCLLEDRMGRYWSFCNRGIWRMKKADLNTVADGRLALLTCVNYGEADGMASAEGNGDQQPNAAALPNWEFWFPTTRGVVIVEPEKLRDNEVPPGVVIEEVRVDDETVFKDGGLVKSEIRSPNSETNPKSGIRRRQNSAMNGDDACTFLRLSPGRARVLEIRYTANTFVGSERARFRYRLEGHESAWHEACTRRTALYTNLRPGDYRFLVEACNRHGTWSEAPATFAFSLAPFFYQTWRFRTLAVALCASTLGGWHLRRLRSRRCLRELEKTRALQEERNRIAKDLHDDLGANLTGVALQIEVAHRQLADPEFARDHLQKTAGAV